jgi:hypothetical protein
MSQPSVFYSDIFVAGSFGCRQFSPPAGCIGNAAIAANAGLQASKLEHQHAIRYSQKAGTAVVSETIPLHIARAAGTVVSVEVVTVTPPTSTDTVTIDLKKGNASTGYATVLTSVVTIDNASVTRTIYSAAITTADYSADDSFELVITATGSSCQGLAVIVTVREAAQ